MGIWITPSCLLFFKRSGSERSQPYWYAIGVTGGSAPKLGKTAVPDRDVFQLTVSQGGRQVLYSSRIAGRDYWMVTDLDGTLRAKWPWPKIMDTNPDDEVDYPFEECVAGWTLGGSAILETGLERSESGDRVYLTATLKRAREGYVAKPLARIIWQSRTVVPVPVPDTPGIAAGFDPYYESGACGTTGRVDVLEALLLDPRPRLVIHAVRFPDCTNVAAMCASPGGDRVVWEVGDPTREVGRPMAARKVDRIPVGIWVSRLDGTEMRVIGYIPPIPGKRRWQYEHFGGLQWTPDGKRISFVYDGCLYVVPADGGPSGTR